VLDEKRYDAQGNRVDRARGRGREHNMLSGREPGRPDLAPGILS
jgi:hypothetical protein